MKVEQDDESSSSTDSISVCTPLHLRLCLLANSPPMFPPSLKLNLKAASDAEFTLNMASAGWRQRATEVEESIASARPSLHLVTDFKTFLIQGRHLAVFAQAEQCAN